MGHYGDITRLFITSNKPCVQFNPFHYHLVILLDKFDINTVCPILQKKIMGQRHPGVRAIAGQQYFDSEILNSWFEKRIHGVIILMACTLLLSYRYLCDGYFFFHFHGEYSYSCTTCLINTALVTIDIWTRRCYIFVQSVYSYFYLFIVIHSCNSKTNPVQVDVLLP